MPWLNFLSLAGFFISQIICVLPTFFVATQHTKRSFHFRSCNNMLADEALRSKLSSLQFDLAVVEVFPFHTCSFLLPHTLNIPYVA